MGTEVSVAVTISIIRYVYREIDISTAIHLLLCNHIDLWKPPGGHRARKEENEGRNMKKLARDEMEDVFEDLGELEDVRALTRKKMIADALRNAMKAQKVTPAEMVRRMKTSRPTVYRLLDLAEPGATLDTLSRASMAVGLDLETRLVPRRRPGGRRTAAKSAA